MDSKNTPGQTTVDPELISQKTSLDELTNIILSDKRNFLVSSSVEEQLQLMAKVREYFFTYSSRGRVVQELVKREKVKESTAWKLVELTPRLYSTYLQPLALNFWVDIHLQKIEETRRMAKELGDTRAMAQADKNRHQAIKDFCGTKEIIDQSKLRLPDVEIGFHPELFKDIPDINSKEYQQIISAFRKRKDLKERQEIQDIDYEDVDEKGNK